MADDGVLSVTNARIANAIGSPVGREGILFIVAVGLPGRQPVNAGVDGNRFSC